MCGRALWMTPIVNGFDNIDISMMTFVIAVIVLTVIMGVVSIGAVPSLHFIGKLYFLNALSFVLG